MPRLRTLTLTTPDGTRLACQVEGQGPPIVFANGFTTSRFFWHDIMPRLRDVATLITWDYRGHGGSEPVRPDTPIDMTTLIDDMRCVLDALAVDTTVLVGFSMGCQVIFEAWRHMPEQIAGLVPLLGPVEHMLNTAIHPRVGRTIAWALDTLNPTLFEQLTRALAYSMQPPLAHDIGRLLGFVGRDAPRDRVAMFRRHALHLDPESVRRIGLAAQRHSARDLLPSIDVPVLLMVGGRDTFAPPHLGTSIRAALPHCEYVFLPDATHTGLFERPELIATRIQRFLQDTLAWI